MTLINVTKLTKEYDGQCILKEIDLKIERGEAFALIGPTGTGKTTLIRLLDLLEEPTSGNIHFDGIDVTHNKQQRFEVRRRLSLVQQKPIVFDMSVYDNIACGLKWRNEKSNVIEQKINNALALVGMNEYQARNAKTLSGGETQRVAIARALVTEPEVMFLDEPTANLDPNTTLKIEEILANIKQEKKTALVMATHDMSQGQRLANRIGVLLDNRVMQVGSPNDIFCLPQSLDVAEFIGIENILPGVVTERDSELLTVKVNSHSLQVVSHRMVGEKVYVLIRPEDITFAFSKEKSSARNSLDGTIKRMTPLGTLVRIEIDCGFPLLGVVTRNSAEELEFKIGKRINASFKATAIHLIERWY
ncbi:MAG: ABC transporter ATP-binding protein [Dehalococcoidales bacterium]|nr:ABC transporter ATP-binding protein [Dehalococcoidales bacterium]